VSSRSRVKPPKVLVVDDDETVARVVAELMRSVGLPVTVAHSVADARRLADHFAVGVFDIDIGGGSGIELARELIAAGCVERVVFFSGSESNDLLQRTRPLGEFLVKGVDTLRLKDHVLGLARSDRSDGTGTTGGS